MDPETSPERASSIRVAFNRDCLDAILEVLDSARETIDVCVFALADDRLTSALFDARRRHVRIRVMTEADTAGNTGADARALMKAGIEVRFETSESLMHHKFLVIDGRVVLTGSLNWTRKAVEFNHENVVILDDRAAAEAFLDEFGRLWTMKGTSARAPGSGQPGDAPPRLRIRRPNHAR